MSLSANEYCYNSISISTTTRAIVWYFCCILLAVATCFPSSSSSSILADATATTSDRNCKRCKKLGFQILRKEFELFGTPSEIRQCTTKCRKSQQRKTNRNRAIFNRLQPPLSRQECRQFCKAIVRNIDSATGQPNKIYRNNTNKFCLQRAYCAKPITIPPTPAPPKDRILDNWDFEDETIFPWMPNGGTALEQSEEHTYSGNYGGLVTEREAIWNGIYQDVTDIVQPGVIYEFSTLAKLVGVDDDYSEQFVFMISQEYRLTVDGETTEHTDYILVAKESDLTNEWTKVSGSFQFNIDDGREYISQKLYAHTTESTSDFAIDEVVMRDALPVNPDVFVDASQNTERVVIPQPPVVDLTGPRTGCPHLETPNLVSWESLYPSLLEGSNLNLPEDTSVLISNTVETELGILTIPDSSKLIFGENENGIALDVGGMDVKGSLIAGSETCRYETPLNITLHGSRPSETREQPHYKGISVTGRIDLHGKRYYRTWTKLARRAHIGDTKLYLQDNVNWESGQEIILTTTALRDSRDWHQNEVFTIDKMEFSNFPDPAVKAIVELTSPVQHHHIARAEYQAEVGLLTRMIKVQGAENDSEPTDLPTETCNILNSYGEEESIFGYDQITCPDTYLTGFGGHIIVHGTGVGYVEGVELYRMGQTNMLGRYPMHFHLLQDNCPGCYFKDSSVHRSFYRCISIHGTNNIMVSENVSFDVTGYCYYLEDGIEEQNTIAYNLAAHIHVLSYPAIGKGQRVNLVRESPDLLLPADITASGFYITNLQNRVIGNVAVGGWAGFAVPNLHQAIGPHQDKDFSPRSRPVLEFDGNTAHSTAHFWGSAAAFYFGGSLYYDSDELVYNAGRDNNGDERKNPCIDDEDGVCQRAWNRITNTKVFLAASVGIGSWSGGMEVLGYECHDCGLAVEALVDGFWIDDMVANCRTGEALILPSQQTHRVRANGFVWYDTNQEHIITSSTFRNCGYRSSSYDQYDTSKTRGCGNNPYNGCWDGSTVFGFLTHWDEFNPELMQATRDLTFEEVGRKFKYSLTDIETNSGRNQNWFDVDGSVSGFGEPTLIGSGLASAGLWWRVDDEVVMDEQGPVTFIKKNAGPARGFAHIRLDWDEALHSTVGEEGGACRRRLMDGGISPGCPAVGRIRHLGTKFNSANDPEGGLPVTPQPEIVGLAGGFGWLLSLDGGAPHTVKISDIEVMPNTPLLLSIAYPLGTSFKIKAKAPWCWETCTRSCEEKFTPVDTVQEVRYSDGNVYHFDKSTGFLTIRIIMFPASHTGEPDWKLFNFDDVDSDGDFELPRFERGGILLPMTAWDASIEIKADCTRNGAYCATAPPATSDYDNVCDFGFTQTSYDRCCDASNNCQDMGLLVPTSAPTVTPAPTFRNPEIIENGDLELGNVCPWYKIECDLEVVNGALSVTNRTESWSGPRQDVTNRIQIGSSYDFVAQVRFPNAGVENSFAAKLAVRYNDSSLRNSYFTVAWSDTVPNDQTTTLSSTFAIDASELDSTGVDSIVLYFETPPKDGKSLTWDFEIDNISMIEVN